MNTICRIFFILLVVAFMQQAHATEKKKTANDEITNSNYLRSVNHIFELFTDLVKYRDKSPEELEALGIIYHWGADGIPQDIDKARALYELAAKGGNSNAFVSLGYLYRNGKGVPVNFKKARYFYERAAELKNPMGLHNLALMYQEGTGVKTDYTKAIELFEKAMKAGSLYSPISLSIMYQNGIGVQ